MVPLPRRAGEEPSPAAKEWAQIAYCAAAAVPSIRWYG